MRELEMEEKIRLLEKEVNLLGDLADNLRLDLKEAVDSLKIEHETLKRILQEQFPDFQKKYHDIRGRVIREIDPEWSGE